MLANIEESKETISFCIKEEETDPTDMTIFNWQWDANPDQFYEETRLYNGFRAANSSKLCFLPILNNTNKQK